MIGEANARQNTNNHKKIAAQSLENDENHENSKISKFKLYQCRLCLKEQNCGKIWSCLQRNEKKKKEKKNFTMQIHNRKSKLMNFVKISIFDSFFIFISVCRRKGVCSTSRRMTCDRKSLF